MSTAPTTAAAVPERGSPERARSPRRPGLGALAALVALAVLAAGCSASGGASDRGSASSTTEAPQATEPDAPATEGTDPQEPAAPPLEWTECGGGFECADLEVPLDHDDPDGPTITVAINRNVADDPAQRVGVLLLNPGGPGASGIELARSFPRGGELGDRFDLVGFDPRGVGESTPLDCRTHLQAMYDADPSIDEPADVDELLGTSEAFVAECEERHGDVLPHLSTTDVARDMDVIRRALGEEQINYLGYSYGTSIGQEYLRLFPERARAFVLDGLVDHEPDGIETATTQAIGFERALDAYVADCDADDCGFGVPARQAIDEVLAAAEEAPIPAPGADRPATPGVVALAFARALYSELLWGSLSSALRDAREGDGTGLVQLADEYLGRDGDEYANGFEVYFAVNCLDESWPDDPEAFLDAAREAAEVAPVLGEAIVNDYVRCALWPVEAAPLEPVPADLEGLGPVLVVSTTNDPATPHENGIAVAEQIPGAVLLTYDGEGHTIALQGQRCIDDLVLAYLADLEVPPEGTVCR